MQLTNTQQYQSALAGYCRTGTYSTIPGVRQQHVTHYRRLVYNVVDDILQSAFPLTYNLLSIEEWDNLVQDFFASHPCQSPQVWYMPKELYEYVAGQQHPLFNKYPFLSELLLFEWLETELFMMEDVPVTYSAEGNLLTDLLIVNPEHQLQYFQYPVHLKKASEITTADAGNYYLIIFREPQTGQVKFMNLSPALVRMIELLSETPMNLASLVACIEQELQVQVNEAIFNMMQQFLLEAFNNRLIIGLKTI